MRKFKKIDVWINLFLLPVSTFISFYFFEETFIYGYLLIGSWQLISIIVHQWKGWFTIKGGIRSAYHTTILVILITVLIPPVNIFLLFALLFIAPFMAGFYAWLCYNEVYVKMRRPLSYLK